jgi:hypothetical protein
MNELDVVRVKNTALVKEAFRGHEVEIQAGWEGTILAIANPSNPSTLMVAFERYSDKPFLVNVDAANLEVIGRETLEL